MPKIADGGRAFPRPASVDTSSGTLPDGDEVIVEQDGMSLRDWFAGMAICGVVAHGTVGCDGLVSRAYAIADAMIAERAKQPE